MYDNLHQQEKSQKQADYNKRNKDIINLAALFRRQFQFDNVDEKARFLNFKRETQEGLAYPCICCHRIFFKSQVISGLLNEIQQKIEAVRKGLFYACITPAAKKMTIHGKIHFCFTCQNHLKRGSMPPLCTMNGLQIEPIPEALQLSDLENTLIARNILFMKIFKMPRSRWSAVKDRIINVPITDNDISQTMSRLTKFPRSMGDGVLVPVQWKRKLEYKQNVAEAYVNPQKLVNALKFLKNKHVAYKDIEINEQIHPQQDVHSNPSDSDTDSEDENYTDPHSIQAYQSCPNQITGMVDDYPEMRLFVNSTDQTINWRARQDQRSSCPIAPGEGKVPTNLMREINWDVNAFPCLFPSGKFGLYHERQIKLSPQKYFLQRLENVSNRFSSNASYVFAALYFLERQQLESQINISYQKGKLIEDKLMSLEDGFSIFDKIPGTPRYWQQRKYEMVARLEQLGAFQFFFTLSCADKRWPENFSSIMLQRGLNITYSEDNSSNNIYKQDIYVNGVPMEEYIANENLNEVVQQNVLAITRNFDHRIRSFVKNIITGKNNPMHVIHYTYRVEFQMRGAPHVHGVLWLDLKDLNKKYSGLTSIFIKLRLQSHLALSEKNLLQKFIDAYISCSLQNDIQDIVHEVQIHHHSKSCKKYDGKCRFHYPKFPSNTTIIAQPLRKEDFKTEVEFNDCKSSRMTVLEKVRKILDNADKDDLDKMEIRDLLNLAGVSEAEYYEALSTSSIGTTVIMKRRVQERFVNNYNPEWLKAWNGNMDLQVCLDFFAIITYITDYYSKDESGLTDVLKEAAKSAKDKSGAERMRFLSQAFLTHRQMGESEAHYRIIPSLHLTQSNLKCVFVASGFPQHRSRFLWKVHDDEGEDEDCDDENQAKFIRLQDRQGKFVQAASIHEKYAHRPQILQNICLAEFATNYDTMSSRQASKINFQNDYQGINMDKINAHWNENLETQLPMYIQLNGGKLGFMKLRNHPSILRLHKLREDKDPHEFFFSELLLYMPWRSEDEIFPNNLERCLALFKDLSPFSGSENQRTKVEVMKEKLFPHRNNVEEARAVIDCLPDNHSAHIGDTIDAAHEQSNIDAGEEGFQADSEKSILDPDNYITGTEESDSIHEKIIYKPIDISNMDAMMQSVRKLVPEQREVFDIIIGYCKNIRKAWAVSCPMPKPPLLKIHGGGGSGKSHLIDDISKWAEFFLRTSDSRQPNQPYVIKVAPTGKAASIIQGMTLHSAFHFKFGNDFTSLSDKMREEMRSSLARLKIIIIDEMSMLKSDLLYQLNLRLQEVKQNQDYFGGVAVLLFGDLMQLRPVQANFIFEPPRSKKFQVSHEINPLWNLFKPIELLHNHRQGSDKSYADALNRIRFGCQSAEDLTMLKARVTTKFPEDAFYVFGTRSAVDELNSQKLQSIQDNPVTLSAIHIHPNKKDFKPYISEKNGTVNDTPFLDKLYLKKNARIMLTYNVDTSDGLTNGTTGTVFGFVNNAQGQIVHVLIKLDEKEFGAQMRMKHAQLLLKLGNNSVTPISRVSFEYSLGSVKHQHTAKAKVIQFPIVLAWAITAHKFQGQTVKVPASLVADLASVFDGGQAYVMLGRVQNISQLYLRSFNEKKIRANQKALEEANKISEAVRKNQTPNQIIWNNQQQLEFLKVTVLNIRSLTKHMTDIQVDGVIMKSDVLCLTETWLTPETTMSLFQLPGFQCITASKGRGAGVAVYVKNNIAESAKSLSLVNANFQAVRITLPCLDIIAVYRSPSSDVKECTKAILAGFKRGQKTIVCGDFNVPIIPNKTNYLTGTLSSIGFQQLVSQPTHLQGNLLDHVYVNFQNGHWFLHSTYYSDHDAICTIIPFQARF